MGSSAPADQSQVNYFVSLRQTILARANSASRRKASEISGCVIAGRIACKNGLIRAGSSTSRGTAAIGRTVVGLLGMARLNERRMTTPWSYAGQVKWTFYV